MRRSFRVFLAFLSFALSVGCENVVGRQEDTLDDHKIHVELTPYLVFGGLSGDMTIRGQTLPVNVSAGDVLGHLQFGFMGRSAISYNRFFVGTDVTYMGLGGSAPAVNVGVDQWASCAAVIGSTVTSMHLRELDITTSPANFVFKAPRQPSSRALKPGGILSSGPKENYP